MLFRSDVTWGQAGGLLKAVGQEPIDITFNYKHGRRRMSGRSRLEVASFTGTDASQNPSEIAARSLDEIATSLAAIAEVVKR